MNGLASEANGTVKPFIRRTVVERNGLDERNGLEILKKPTKFMMNPSIVFFTLNQTNERNRALTQTDTCSFILLASRQVGHNSLIHYYILVAKYSGVG
jgi:hypothetical protein